VLILVGFGISGFKGISLEGLEAIKEADKVYLEAYTSPVGLSVRELEEIIGKEVSLLSRRDLEESTRILDESIDKKVVVLTPGDPLIATTHVSLVLEAKKRGIDVKVIHAASIYTVAMGESGLQAYKFGRMATLTVPDEFVPLSVYEVIVDNKRRGLHTLLLLQQDISSGEFLSVKEALSLLVKMEDIKKEGAVSKDTIAIVLANLGFSDQVKVAGRIKNLMRFFQNFPPKPAVIIIPGKLHFMEKEAIMNMWIDEDER